MKLLILYLKKTSFGKLILNRCIIIDETLYDIRTIYFFGYSELPYFAKEYIFMSFGVASSIALETGKKLKYAQLVNRNLRKIKNLPLINARSVSVFNYLFTR
jgi:hypothetical protein